MRNAIILFTFILQTILACSLSAQEDKVFKVFSFPENKIPQIDGNTADWDMVPDSYAIGMDEMTEDEGKYAAPDKNTLDIKVKVGWVKGLNRLYFLYEAYDNYWSFSRDDLMTDIFEVVVDGDRSGGAFIEKFYPFKDVSKKKAWELFQGRQAQNYHIYTPPHKDGDWCMYWGPQQWLKEKPYSDYAYNYSFKEGEGGKLTLEFYITPFDYASPEGADHSVASELTENKLIGLCWAVIDYDNSEGKAKDGFWNLSRHHTMYGDASLLRTFRLMPDRQVKIACVGNSITEGAAASDRKNKGYVGLLGQMMGGEYDVQNFGVSGTTACKNTYKPYDKCVKFPEAKAFQPDIVTIALGTNDSQPRVWNTGDFAANFEKDLIWLCEEFEKLESKPTIYLCLPMPIILSERWQHQPEVLSDEIIPLIRKVAESKGYGIIDLHTPLIGCKDCYPLNDMLHPNDLGHEMLAKQMYQTLSTK
jgi:lysophospholipase L1-like esterase